MKHLLTLIAFALAGICFAAEAPAPRVLTITGTHHPKALVVSVDAPTGTLMFRWLNSAGEPVDSGGSIARFTPVAPVAPVAPSKVPTYPAPSDATLTAAIVAAAQ